MRYNNNVSAYDDITVVLPASTNVNTIKVYRYVVGSTKQAETFTTSVKGDYLYVTIPAVKVSCHVLIDYGFGGSVVRVGEPPTLIIAYYQNTSNESVTYQQFDYDSNLLASGTMNKIASNFYAVLVTKVVRSFFNILDRIITLTLPEKYVGGSDFTAGTIELQRGCWQIIAIPTSGKVKDVFIDVIAKQEGVDASSLFEVVSAYPGSVNKFLSYKPGLTLETSEHNFDLLINDNGSKEITGFWVKCNNWTHRTDNIVFKWGV